MCWGNVHKPHYTCKRFTCARHVRLRASSDANVNYRVRYASHMSFLPHSFLARLQPECLFCVVHSHSFTQWVGARHAALYFVFARWKTSPCRITHGCIFTGCGGSGGVPCSFQLCAKVLRYGWMQLQWLREACHKLSSGS